jgi:hypothetical protein
VNTLNSREIAVAFWTIAFVIGALSINGVRESAWKVAKHALVPKLIFVWLSLAAYAWLLVLPFRELGLWTTDLQKDTLIWFACSALAYPFQFHDPQKAPRVLRVLVRDSLSVLIVIEVLVRTYPFSLPLELVIVPIVTLIAMIGAVAEIREEHKPVAKLLGTVQALLGFVLISIAIRRAAGDPNHSFLPALVSSLIVVVLSLACWPYIYLLRLGFAHEGMLWRIGWKKNVSRVFKNYAVFRILRYLQFRPTAVGPFIRRNAFRLDDVVDRRSLEKLVEEDRNTTSDEPDSTS